MNKYSTLVENHARQDRGLRKKTTGERNCFKTMKMVRTLVAKISDVLGIPKEGWLMILIAQKLCSSNGSLPVHR